MIIFGWGKRTMKDYGQGEVMGCGRCRNQSAWSYRLYITWFTLFFIPIIPYEFLYVKVCPVCGHYESMQRDEFHQARQSATANTTEHASSTVAFNDGLTETQRNYKAQMQEYQDKQK